MEREHPCSAHRSPSKADDVRGQRSAVRLRGRHDRQRMPALHGLLVEALTTLIEEDLLWRSY